MQRSTSKASGLGSGFSSGEKPPIPHIRYELDSDSGLVYDKNANIDPAHKKRSFPKFLEQDEKEVEEEKIKDEKKVEEEKIKKEDLDKDNQIGIKRNLIIPNGFKEKLSAPPKEFILNPGDVDERKSLERPSTVPSLTEGEDVGFPLMKFIKNILGL